MTKRSALRGKAALITGAGSGIGRALAHELAGRGCHLALADINAAALAQTAAALQGRGLRVSTHELDVADRAQVAALPAAVLAAHDAVHLLVNNAGVALGGSFEMVSEADFDWLFEINFHAVVRMTRAFLPHLRRAAAAVPVPGGAHIVNLSSLFGIIAPPGQVAYAASKFAVRGFSHALRHELEGSGIAVSVVHPGGVATDIAHHARIAQAVPEDQRAQGLARMQRRRARIIVGRDARIAAFIEWLMPVRYWQLLGRRMGASES